MRDDLVDETPSDPAIVAAWQAMRDRVVEEPAPVTYADTDPCPAANRIGRLEAWQHAHPVSCSTCGRYVRCSWWSVEHGHRCGRCHRAPVL